jgi:hypothetical protein
MDARARGLARAARKVAQLQEREDSVVRTRSRRPLGRAVRLCALSIRLGALVIGWSGVSAFPRACFERMWLVSLSGGCGSSFEAFSLTRLVAGLMAASLPPFIVEPSR